MLKKLLVVIAIATLSVALAGPVSAGELALTSPHGMDNLKVGQGVPYSFEVGVHNEGTDQMHIKMSADGSIAEHLAFSHLELDLGAGESKKVKIDIALLPTGIYEGMISATQMVPDSSDGGTAMHAGISLSAPIRITVGDPQDTPADNDNTPTDDNDEEQEEEPEDGTTTPPSSGQNPLEIAAIIAVVGACIITLLVPKMRKEKAGAKHEG